MRILQLSSARHFGGGERHLIDLTNGLAKRGHELFVGVVSNSPLLSLLNLPKENIFPIPFSNALNVSNAWRLGKFVRNQQIDIIHAHMGRDYPLAALAVGRAESTRLVITRHVMFPLGQIHRLTKRRVSRVIAVSEAVASSLRRQGIFDKDAIRVVKNGIDVGCFSAERTSSSSESIGEGTLRAGMLGELSQVKGQRDLIQAAAIIAAKHANVQFVIAGRDKSSDHRNRRELDELINACGLEHRVEVIDSDLDVPEFLKTLDVFVSASHSEAFGLAIVEAMAAGVAVVATMTEGALEIIRDESTGLLTPVGDPEQLALKVSLLLNNAAKRQELSANARDQVARQFTLERMIAETESVYREALS